MQFSVLGGAPLTLSVDTELVVAGYTGRDRDAVQHHIDELAAIGVAPPPRVPMVYRFPLKTLTFGGDLAVPSGDTSGEVEPILVRQSGTWYLGVGSDHTDRGLERESIERSKAVCPKPVADTLIQIDGDVAGGVLDDMWDNLEIRSWVDGTPYQRAGLVTMRTPSDLLATVLPELPAEADLVVFAGTVPLLTGSFVYGSSWRVELQYGEQTLRLDYHTSVHTPEGADA